MDFFSLLFLRIFGITGILGAILFMAGDLSYNHIPGSKASPTEKMSRMPASRLLRAGVLGLIGCWLYALSAFHLYSAFRPVGEQFAFVLSLFFTATAICYGITHTAYFAIAAGAQASVRLGADAEEGGKLGNRFYARLVYITYIPVAVVSALMIYGIISGRSLYPQWMALFLPITIYILRKPVIGLLQGRLREIINDSYDNFILLIFFLLSTVVLWNAIPA